MIERYYLDKLTNKEINVGKKAYNALAILYIILGLILIIMSIMRWTEYIYKSTTATIILIGFGISGIIAGSFYKYKAHIFNSEYKSRQNSNSKR